MRELLRLLRESLPEIIGGLVVAAILSVVGVIYAGFGLTGVLAVSAAVLSLSVLVALLVSRRKLSSVSAARAKLIELVATPDSELISRFRLRRHQIVANIHDKYSLELDNPIRSALIQLNTQRREQGLKEYFASTRFRLILPPRYKETGIELHLAPMNFTYLIMLKDPSVSSDFKECVRDRIEQIASHIAKSLQSTHPVLNARNYHPLGIEFVIVTRDKRTLLRRRGESVLLSTVEWDVSYSGYCGESDRLPNGELDIALTVEHELHREIGILTADHREITFTGLHRNTATGAIDILGIWQTEAKTSELVDLLNEKYPGLKKVFGTTKRTEEPFVWDSKNLIVDFNSVSISHALREIGRREGKPSVLIPEARIALILALEAAGQSTTELAY